MDKTKETQGESEAILVKKMPSRAEQRFLERRVNRDSRARSGRPTGTTPHFREWQADLQVRSQLQRMRIDQMADSLASTEPAVAGALAIIRVNSSIKSVWDLARSRRSDLLAIRDIGPKRLEVLQTYFRGKRVALDWAAG